MIRTETRRASKSRAGLLRVVNARKRLNKGRSLGDLNDGVIEQAQKQPNAALESAVTTTTTTTLASEPPKPARSRRLAGHDIVIPAELLAESEPSERARLPTKGGGLGSTATEGPSRVRSGSRRLPKLPSESKDSWGDVDSLLDNIEGSVADVAEPDTAPNITVTIDGSAANEEGNGDGETKGPVPDGRDPLAPNVTVTVDDSAANEEGSRGGETRKPIPNGRDPFARMLSSGLKAQDARVRARSLRSLPKPPTRVAEAVTPGDDELVGEVLSDASIGELQEEDGMDAELDSEELDEDEDPAVAKERLRFIFLIKVSCWF